ERLMLVKMLKEKGVFNLQKSVPYVAERMGVSKYTIYNYLNELENI
ncbi:MAG: helix-turn-helix domain-containing protein, partial [Firmicutes bacterium]|nr:helix-turn-helix domain-containing protein [Bacillota bacterium]